MSNVQKQWKTVHLYPIRAGTREGVLLHEMTTFRALGHISARRQMCTWPRTHQVHTQTNLCWSSHMHRVRAWAFARRARPFTPFLVRVHFCTGRYGKQRTTSICSEGKQYICGLYSEANVYVIEATNISSHLSFWMKGFQCPPSPKNQHFILLFFQETLGRMILRFLILIFSQRALR